MPGPSIHVQDLTQQTAQGLWKSDNHDAHENSLLPHNRILFQSMRKEACQVPLYHRFPWVSQLLRAAACSYIRT